MTFGKRHPSGFPFATDRRVARREPVSAVAEILLPTGIIKCRLLDISETGARLSVGRTFGLPEHVQIRRHTFAARVVRSRGGEIGVRFT
jgi:PilZ domain